LVKTFSSVTGVPSTSANTSEIFRFCAIGLSGAGQPSGRHARSSRAAGGAGPAAADELLAR
jgi:hypothetical protein